LADTYVLIPEYLAGSIEDYIPLATAAIDKALSINPASSRALTTRGYLRAMYKYDIKGAIADFERAIELEPGYATAHQWYGEILAASRRLDDALDQVKIAIQLDPLAPVIHHVEGWLLAGGMQFDAALESYKNVHKVDPNYAHTFANLTMLYTRIGEYDLARKNSAKTLEFLTYDNSPTLAVIDAVENPALVQRAVELIQNAPTGIYSDGASGKAQYYMLLGEHELALDNLEQAFEAGDPYAIHANRFDQYYAPIRKHPRFQALLRKMNLLP